MRIDELGPAKVAELKSASNTEAKKMELAKRVEEALRDAYKEDTDTDSFIHYIYYQRAERLRDWCLEGALFRAVMKHEGLT